MRRTCRGSALVCNCGKSVLKIGRRQLHGGSTPPPSTTPKPDLVIYFLLFARFSARDSKASKAWPVPLRYKYSTVRIFSFLNNLRGVRIHRTDSGASRATFFREQVHGGLRATESQCDRWPKSDCVQRCCVGCSVGDMEDRSELRSRALARNKRELTAVKEIPAASATSLLDL
jgi:hypothetical protein